MRAGCLVALIAVSRASLWPMPAGLTMGGEDAGVLSLNTTFTISCEGACPDPLPAALQRYQALIFFAGPPAAATGPVLQRLQVLVVANT